MTGLAWIAVVALAALTSVAFIATSVRLRKPPGPRCRRCDYHLAGVTAVNCPECGWRIDAVRAARVRRLRRPLRSVLGLVLLGVTVGIAAGTTARNKAQALLWQDGPIGLLLFAAERDIGTARRGLEDRALELWHNNPPPSSIHPDQAAILGRALRLAEQHVGDSRITDPGHAEFLYWYRLVEEKHLATIAEGARFDWLQLAPRVSAAPDPGDPRRVLLFVGLQSVFPEPRVTGVAIDGRPAGFTFVTARIPHDDRTALRLAIDTREASLPTDARVTVTLALGDLEGQQRDFSASLTAIGDVAAPPVIQSDDIAATVRRWYRGMAVDINITDAGGFAACRQDAVPPFDADVPRAIVTLAGVVELADGSSFALPGTLVWDTRDGFAVGRMAGDLDASTVERLRRDPPATATLRIRARADLFAWRWGSEVPWWDGEVVFNDFPVNLTDTSATAR